MPRYLVTLRHAATGETLNVPVKADSAKDAYFQVYEHASLPDEVLKDWGVEYACPADDAPVPGRDR